MNENDIESEIYILFIRCCLREVCHLRRGQGDDANVSLRPPSRLSKMLREDNSDGRLAENAAVALCNLSNENHSTETDNEWICHTCKSYASPCKHSRMSPTSAGSD